MCPCVSLKSMSTCLSTCVKKENMCGCAVKIGGKNSEREFGRAANGTKILEMW